MKIVYISKQIDALPPCRCDRVHIILVSYACEPNAGSEPGVAWGLIRELAKRVHYTVITRANNKQLIDAEAATAKDAEWIYVDLSNRRILNWKKSRPATMIYYLIWQAVVGILVRRLQRRGSYAAVHHLSLMSYMFVGLHFAKPPRIIGPFGGLEQLPRELWKRALRHPGEALRTFRIMFRWFDPNWWLLNKRGDVLLPANLETYSRLTPQARLRSVISQIGISSRPASLPLWQHTKWASDFPRGEAREAPRVLWAGAHRYEKGLDIAITALSHLTHGIGTAAQLVVTGSGPETARARRLAERLGISERVHFQGRLTHDDYRRLLGSIDIFLFTSLHETTGVALLEAMQVGIPPIVIRRGGPADIVRDGAGISIAPNKPELMHRQIASAIEMLLSDETLARSLSAGAKVRAADYSWQSRANAIWAVYRSILPLFRSESVGAHQGETH